MAAKENRRRDDRTNRERSSSHIVCVNRTISSFSRADSTTCDECPGHAPMWRWWRQLKAARRGWSHHPRRVVCHFISRCARGMPLLWELHWVVDAMRLCEYTTVHVESLLQVRYCPFSDGVTDPGKRRLLPPVDSITRPVIGPVSSRLDLGHVLNGFRHDRLRHSAPSRPRVSSPSSLMTHDVASHIEVRKTKQHALTACNEADRKGLLKGDLAAVNVVDSEPKLPILRAQ